MHSEEHTAIFLCIPSPIICLIDALKHSVASLAFKLYSLLISEKAFDNFLNKIKLFTVYYQIDKFFHEYSRQVFHF